MSFKKKNNVCYNDQFSLKYSQQIDGLVQERRNSIANALELRLSCTNRWVSARNT